MKQGAEQLGHVEAPEIREPKRVFVEVGPKRAPAPSYGTIEFGPNDVYVGIDIGAEDLREGKRDTETLRRIQGKEGKMFFVKGTGEAMPLQDKSVDELIFINILGEERIEPEAKERFLAEAARVLKEKGELVIGETYTPPPVPELEGMLERAGLAPRRVLGAHTPGFEGEVRKYEGEGGIALAAEGSYYLFAGEKRARNETLDRR